MAQSIKYPTTANFVQKTLGAQLLAGATASATLNNVTSIQNKPGVMIIDRVDTNNVETPTKREVIVYTATSGVTVTGLTRNADGSGTDQDHAVGAIVEFGPDVMWAQSLIDGLSQVVDTSTGLVDLTKIPDLSSAQTLTNKTLASPNIQVGSDAAGDLHYRGSGASLLRLPIGSVPSLLLANASLPYWGFISGASGSILTSTGNSSSPVMAPASSASTDGWTASSDTWVYASASTFTIAGVDRTTTFTKGTRLKFTQTTAKYAVVVSSSFSTNTTVTIAVNTDYTIANAAISSPYYSYAANPQGFPGWFAYTPTYGGFSVDPTYPMKFSIIANTCFIAQNTATGADGTSNATTFTFTLPVAPINGNFGFSVLFVKDNGANQTTPGNMELAAASATVNVYKTFYNGAWTNSGAKVAHFGQFAYQF